MFTLRKRSNLFAPFLIAALLALAVAGAAPAATAPASALTPTFYVKPTGLDTNTCNTPALACQTIQGAIGKAASGGTVKVAVGTYAVRAGPQVVLVNKNLKLLGGWNNAFTAQTGRSTIEGANLRRGVLINAGLTVTMDRFQVQHGYSASGGGIFNAGTLTLGNSVITENYAAGRGAGILNAGTLTINNSTISGNTGGSGIMVSGTNTPVLTVNNSTISNNTTMNRAGGGIHAADDYRPLVVTLNNTLISGNEPGGLWADGTITVNNSTFTGNLAGTEGAWGLMAGQNVTINNTTITGNAKGLEGGDGIMTFTNSIVAGNSSDGGLTPADCDSWGTVQSGGYNLVGSATGCGFTATTGDQFGTADTPIDAKLGPLANHGGPTLTHALLAGSPAINAGNATAEPGSGGGACLPTDQRGFSRPALAAGTCDIGAYESFVLSAMFIKRLDAATTSASSVRYSVAFSDLVTGVEAGDFALTTSGITGASVAGVTGGGNSYVVTVNTGTGAGTLRLDLVDDDGILGFYDGAPLGGAGTGNGDFMTGDVYTLRIPAPISPAGTIWDTTPTYKWLKVAGATQYRYQLARGTTTLYTYIVPSTACGATTCSATPTKVLYPAAYKWRAQALVGAAWKPYTAYATFTLQAPKPGYWDNLGSWVSFYVTSSGTQLRELTFYPYECGTLWSLTYNSLVPITLGKFSLATASGSTSITIKGSFALANGFSTQASGTAAYTNLLFPCGVRSHSGTWSNSWQDSTQPAIVTLENAAPTILQPLDGTLTLQQVTR